MSYRVIIPNFSVPNCVTRFQKINNITSHIDHNNNITLNRTKYIILYWITLFHTILHNTIPWHTTQHNYHTHTHTHIHTHTYIHTHTHSGQKSNYNIISLVYHVCVVVINMAPFQNPSPSKRLLHPTIKGKQFMFAYTTNHIFSRFLPAQTTLQYSCSCEPAGLDSYSCCTRIDNFGNMGFFMVYLHSHTQSDAPTGRQTGARAHTNERTHARARTRK